MSYENILFDISAGVARLTLNRPDKLNSFTAAMHEEIREAVARVQAEAAVPCASADRSGARILRRPRSWRSGPGGG